MEKVARFQDLEVYKIARELAKEIFEHSKKFPKEEMYSLTDQIRRSSRSVGGQIAEAMPTLKLRQAGLGQKKIRKTFREQADRFGW